MVGDDVRCFARDHRRMNLGIKWLTPGESRLVDVDLALALVKFSHDLFHSYSVATTEKIPIGKFSRRGLYDCGKEKRYKTGNGYFHGGSFVFCIERIELAIKAFQPVHRLLNPFGFAAGQLAVF